MDLLLNLLEDFIMHITGRAIEDAYDHGSRKRRKILLLIAALAGIPALLSLLIFGIVESNGVLILCASLLLLFLILWLMLRFRECRQES